MSSQNFPSWKDINYMVFDFDGVFTNNKVLIQENNLESIVCDRSDGLGFDILRKFCELNSWNPEFFVLSKETNDVVIKRCNKLGIQCFTGINDKLDFLMDKYKNIYNVKSNVFERLVYLGNDLNDLKALQKAQYSFSPIDSHPIIKNQASFVLPIKGGEGFVRLFLEEILLIDKMDNNTLLKLL